MKMKNLIMFGIRELENRSKWVQLYINQVLNQEYMAFDEMYEVSIQSQDDDIQNILQKVSAVEKVADGVVITVTHDFYDLFVRLLQSIKWNKEVYLVPEYLVGLPVEQIKAQEFLMPVDAGKPCLRYFEFHLCDHCNLKCKGCSHLSNVCDEKFADKEQYLRDLEQIKRLYWGMQAIKLLGGEPLLNKELPEYMYETRKRFPEVFFYIATNGLLLPKMPEEFFEAARKTHAIVMLSAYQPTLKMKDEIEGKLRQENIQYFYTPEVKEFQKMRYTQSKCIDRETAHQRCRADMPEPCVTLREGKLYQCGLPYLEFMNDKFGTEFKLEKGDWVDLYEETSGWEANKRLYEPIPFCEYCGVQPESFVWEPMAGKEAALEDYLNRSAV